MIQLPIVYTTVIYIYLSNIFQLGASSTNQISFGTERSFLQSNGEEKTAPGGDDSLDTGKAFVGHPFLGNHCEESKADGSPEAIRTVS